MNLEVERYEGELRQLRLSVNPSKNGDSYYINGQKVYCQEYVEKLERDLEIAVEVLVKIKNDISPPWDNTDFKRLSREALSRMVTSKESD